MRILKQHNQAGFTLLEVIISLAILGIVVFPISSIFTGSARQSQKSKERLQANHTAQKYMEFLKSKKGKEIDQYIGTLDTIPEPVKDGETGFNVRYYAMYLKDGDANKYEIYEENRETEYDLEIILNNISTKINGKNINVDSNDHINIEIDKNIQIKKNDNEWDTYDLSKENIYIDNERNIDINIYNRSGDIFNVYVKQDLNKDMYVHCYEGKVKMFDEYVKLEDTNISQYRMYKLVVEVYDSEGNLITRLDGTKKGE